VHGSDGHGTIAVLLATIHRPTDLARAVRSALASRHDAFEVVVIDQGSDAGPVEALGGLRDDPRVRYTRMAPRGLSAALNHGATITGASILAITGDDCTMPPDWLAAIDEAFADSRIAVVFRSVGSAPCDPATGFVPGCRIDAPFTAHAITDLAALSGTTACMAVRRDVWNALGGFDEALGVGASLRSAEDLDLALHALHAGWLVLQTPAVQVTHHSPVPWSERATVVRRNWYGSGAVMAKWLKLAGLPMVTALARLAGRWVSGGSGVAATYGYRPARGAMLVGFVSGFLVGIIWPLDRRRRHFRRAPSPDPGSETRTRPQ
jgi:hypothetical protein